MLCQNCKQNEATSHIKQVINGKTKEYYLCSDCANKIGFGSMISGMNFDLDDFFTGFFDSGSMLESNRLICPVCKSSFTDLSKTGKVGCSNCYETFEKELSPTIERIHGKTSHKGKIPNCAGKKLKKLRKIENLKHKLEKAIKEENFELAAKIRDEIKEFEKEDNCNE